MSLITLFENFLFVWLLQTGYSCSLSRELIKKTCLCRLSNTRHFAQTGYPKSSKSAAGRRRKINVEPETDHQTRTCELGNTWLSQAAKIFTLKEMFSEHPFLPHYWLLIFIFMCPPVQGFVTYCKHTLGLQPGQEIGKEMSVTNIFPLLLLV